MGDKFPHYYLNPVYILKVEIEGVSSGNRALVAIRLVIINNLLLLYLTHCKYFSSKFYRDDPCQIFVRSTSESDPYQIRSDPYQIRSDPYQI